jgi:transcriptional regulator with XRE-family HTH domain
MLDMPARIQLPSASERDLLMRLGENLRATRTARKISAQSLAQDAGMSRTTLHAIELGDPSVTMGSYLRVMTELGVGAHLPLLGSAAAPAALEARQQTPAYFVASTPTRSEPRPHALQDLQSLLMHEKAVSLIKRDPALRTRALGILDNWRTHNDINAQPLLDEWQRILLSSDWKKALSRSQKAQQLRQASPLPGLLAAEDRMQILQQVRALRNDPAQPSAEGHEHATRTA